LLVEQEGITESRWSPGPPPTDAAEIWDLWLAPGKSPEEIFGDEVARARKAAGLTQEELSRQVWMATGVAIHPTAIAKLERGKRRRAIRVNEAAALAHVLGISLGYLLRPRDKINDPTHYAAVQAEERRLAEAVERDDELLRERTVELALVQRGADERRERLDRMRRMLAGYNRERQGDLWAGTEWESTDGGER
jgi:transcriptional regulator with XRE-family HTH domain